MISNIELQKLLSSKGYAGEELVPMVIRTRLLVAVNDHIESRQLNPAQIATALGVKESRVSELKKLHIEKFSTELLLKYARRLGLRVKLEISVL